MRVKKYLLFAVSALFVLSTGAYAAPVGLASQADLTKGSDLIEGADVKLDVGFIMDSITDRNIDIESGEFEMTAYMFRIGLSALEKYYLYLDVGETEDMEYNYVIQGEKYKSEFGGETVWGVGLNALIYRWNNGLEVGASAGYREADMLITKSTIDNVAWDKNQMGGLKNDGKFTEYQMGLQTAYKTKYITPYVGIKYSDVEVDCNFTLGGAVRNASGRNADENLGVFLGCSITPEVEGIKETGQFSINVEGRFMDEKAFNFGICYKF